MLNEDRTKVMTKLAIFEERNHKSITLASKYKKNDYISYHMIWTGITTTCAYLLLVILGICYRLEFYMVSIHKLDLMDIGKNLVFAYIGFLVIFEILAYFVFKKKFKQAQKDVKQYCAGLHELEKLYNRERPKA